MLLKVRRGGSSDLVLTGCGCYLRYLGRMVPGLFILLRMQTLETAVLNMHAMTATEKNSSGVLVTQIIMKMAVGCVLCPATRVDRRKVLKKIFADTNTIDIFCY